MTVSVMVWRETFSVWTLMAGSFFRNAQNVAAPSRATMMLAMMMNFPRLLRLGLGASAVGGKIGGVSTRRACPKTHELSRTGIALAATKYGRAELLLTKRRRSTTALPLRV